MEDFIRFADCLACGRGAMRQGEKAIFVCFGAIAEHLRWSWRAVRHGGLTVQSHRMPLCPEAPLAAAPGDGLRGGVAPFSTAPPSRCAGSTLSLWGPVHLSVLSVCAPGREGVAA